MSPPRIAAILVAEDDPAVGQFVTRALATRGHDVVLATDGAAALALLHERRFDLLLTDIVMPMMDGIALALAASAEFPDMPILMMTGYAQERQRAYNLDSLIHDVILKPFSMAQIIETVENALPIG
ncbi:response regulator [Zavarzinia sp. CC-PAN008]|uniref:response regulator n=1 Tax=Zavarzinia sp. CC-PAN008 TaxID=3243332 RepID=UPI003F747986